MRIRKYGIELIRVKEKDIELIREKRNSDAIRSCMQFKSLITKEMQKEWFLSIHNIYNNYFLISVKGKTIGLINGKNIDYDKRTSEGGMFIWDKGFQGAIEPAFASVIMSDFNFIINEFRKNYIKILKSNTKAINHNKQLGYIPTTDIPSDNEVQWFELTSENYMLKMQKLRKAITLGCGDTSILDPNDFDFKDDSEEEIRSLYSGLPDYLKIKINQCLKRDCQELLSIGNSL
jgi:hypothetical protein